MDRFSVRRILEIMKTFTLTGSEVLKLASIISLCSPNICNQVSLRQDSSSGIGLSTYATIDGIEHDITDVSEW
jgi:hypothetical protein